MLTAEGCARRRERLAAAMESSGWDLFLTGNYRTAYYFSGVLAAAESPVAYLQWPDGRHELLKAETYSASRCVTHPFHDLGKKIAGALGGVTYRNPAVECAGTLVAYAAMLPEFADATTAILQLRRKKEADEIAEIRASLRLCGIAYETARRVIRPGLTELDVYLEMHGAISREWGSAVPFPGDFACGARAIKEGGPATARVLQEGDLYILDLFPAPALYFGDTCRTFAVGGNPSARQLEAWDAVMEARALGESLVRPGASAGEVHGRVKAFLDAQAVSEGSFWHHLGHGIGHHGHEAPRIMAPSEDVFEEGDVITLEPGVYSEALQGGIRLEDNYIVLADGLERLFEHPLEL